jgi:hypothetical protein
MRTHAKNGHAQSEKTHKADSEIDKAVASMI